MPIYKYKAVKSGTEYEGVRDLPDKGALYSEVKREGGMIVSVEEQKQKATSSFSFKLGGRVKTDEKRPSSSLRGRSNGRGNLSSGYRLLRSSSQ